MPVTYAVVFVYEKDGIVKCTTIDGARVYTNNGWKLVASLDPLSYIEEHYKMIEQHKQNGHDWDREP